ncbi:hypothetical protein EC991_003962 [Linnemannia zychae]|nr:hypothetical protein EC991_003962 [Linnemannia zychae]
MVLWSSGNNGGRGRILSSKRTLLSGSLLLLVLFYYVALPDPQVGTMDDRTAVQADSAFRMKKKGSALADDTEIMMPLPAREDGPGSKTLPWLNSFVERVKLDRRLPVMDYIRGGQEMTVDSDAAVLTADCDTKNDASESSCVVASTSSVRTPTLDTTGMDMLADRDPLANPFSGTDKDVTLETQPVELEVMEDDEGNVIDVTPVEDTTTDEWSSEKEAESIQEEDDQQGFEKEDGSDEELLELEEVEAVSEMEAEAKARVEEAEEVLEDAIEEMREEREEEILEETEDAILERIEEIEEESGGVLTEEMVRMIEDEVVAEEEGSIEEDMHDYVETLFRDGEGEDDVAEIEGEDVTEIEGEDVAEIEGEDVADIAETESEVEYKKEDMLGQAGPGETMDDEE